MALCLLECDREPGRGDRNPERPRQARRTRRPSCWSGGAPCRRADPGSGEPPNRAVESGPRTSTGTALAGSRVTPSLAATSWETVVSEPIFAPWPTGAPAWRHTSIVWSRMQCPSSSSRTSRPCRVVVGQAPGTGEAVLFMDEQDELLPVEGQLDGLGPPARQGHHEQVQAPGLERRQERARRCLGDFGHEIGKARPECLEDRRQQVGGDSRYHAESERPVVGSAPSAPRPRPGR